MTQELLEHCEVEGISKDDILNKEIEEEHAEAYLKECEKLATDIKNHKKKRNSISEMF